MRIGVAQRTSIESRPYRIYRIPTGVFSGYFLRGTESGEGDFGSDDVLYSRPCSREKRADQILENTRVRDGNYENSTVRLRTRAHHEYAFKNASLSFKQKSFVTLFVGLELCRDWIADSFDGTVLEWNFKATEVPARQAEASKKHTISMFTQHHLIMSRHCVR